MNIRNFCIFPNGDSYWPDDLHPKRKPKHLRGTSWTLTKELAGGRFLWLPLKLTWRSKIKMPNPLIIFNINHQDVARMESRFHEHAYYYSLEDESWKEPSLQLPVEAIERAYTFCDNAIEWGKEHNERFLKNHDRFVEKILEPNRTGYSRWLLRGLLYGSLLKVYRADMEAQRKNRRIYSNLFQKFVYFKKKWYLCIVKLFQIN